MKAKKTSVSELKLRLAKKSKDELLKEVLSLYKKIPAVKDYYSALIGDPMEVLEQYKSNITKEFISSGKSLPKARFSVARKSLNDFKKICSDPILIAELIFHYAFCLTDFNSEFGPDVEEFYIKAETLFQQSLELAKQHNALDIFKYRAENLVREACDGWGFKDSLSDIYSEYYEMESIS